MVSWPTCSGAGYSVYDLDSCNNGGDPPAIINSQTCVDVTALLDLGSWSMKATGAQTRGSCPAGGGSPQGQVNPQGPVTFCCEP